MNTIKQIKQIKENLYHIISEPGDATRYEYLMLQDEDDFFFMPTKRDIVYPQRINYHDVKEYQRCTPQTIQYVSGKKPYYCNLYTFIECVKTLITFGRPLFK